MMMIIPDEKKKVNLRNDKKKKTYLGGLGRGLPVYKSVGHTFF